MWKWYAALTAALIGFIASVGWIVSGTPGTTPWYKWACVIVFLVAVCALKPDDKYPMD